MTHHVVEFIFDSVELAALAAFLAMVAGVARWLGG